MRERKRRRSTLVGLVDITNIIESPPVDFNSDQGLRRSRRLQHKSLCTSEFESASHKELFSRSSTSRRKSLRCQQKQLNTDNRTSNIPQPTSQIECDMSVRDINLETCNTVFSSNNLPVLSPNKSENVTPSYQSPTSVSDFYLPKIYIPPKQKGLATVIEHSVDRNQRRPRFYRRAEHSPIRRQIFTGQTLEEACTPTAPGVAPLDPQLVLSITRKQVLKRQKRAKKLGFRGINISEKTEENFAKFVSEST